MAAEGVFHPLGFNEVGGNGHAVNGRVATMAAIGASAQHYIKFPGSESPPIELSVLVGLGVVDFTVPVGPAADDDMRRRELSNGRMAMFAAQGIFDAELLTGQDALGLAHLGAGMLGHAMNLMLGCFPRQASPKRPRREDHRGGGC